MARIGAVADPHEIANVMGTEGVEYMLDNAKGIPFYTWFGVPSCVPATIMETSGAIIDADETARLLEREDLHFLAEMMNYPGVLNKDPEVMRKIEDRKKRRETHRRTLSPSNRPQAKGIYRVWHFHRS